jgi:voltage-gated potassium channel
MTMARQQSPTATAPGFQELGRPSGQWRGRLYDVVFESDTRAGRTFDIALMALILFSVLVVMLDSIPSVATR